MPGRAEIGAAKVEWGVATHIGAGHERNQDAYCTQPPVFVVADGIGGHADGHLASHEVIEALLALTGRDLVDVDMFTESLRDARARIGRRKVDGGRPPGSTLTGVLITNGAAGPSWMVANIGDSRTYRLDSAELKQLTVDHSVVQEMIDAGAVVQSARRDVPFRNMLTRAITAGDDYQPDVWFVPMSAGDRILACSDGVHGLIDHSAIELALRQNRDPQSAAEVLVHMAVDAGGYDDMTAVVVDAVAISGGAVNRGTGR
jgi:PPM family protein phosphatase